MKKRYLSMLMAVVMCLSFGITGALAAEEPAVETAEVSTETAAPASEQPVESAAPSETATAVETAADVPTPVSVQAGAVALDGASVTCNGVAIAGYGGTVVASLNSARPTLSWTSPTPEDVTDKFTLKDVATGDYTLELTVGSNTTAGDYSFQVKGSLEGTLNVLTLDAAIEANKVTSEGFTLRLWGGKEDPLASPDPLAGAEFGLYTANPSDDESATPVTKFTTNENGCATIELNLEDVNAEDLPTIGEDVTYYLKQLTTAEGWYCPTTVTPVQCRAQWATDSSGATTGLKFVLQKPTSNYYFNVTNYKPAYEGFDLYAWTAENVTSDEGYTTKMLPGVEFTVFEYENGEIGTDLATFITDADGKVTIDPAQFGLTWTAGEEKTFCLFQTTASVDAEHGERPLPGEGWEFSAEAVASSDGSKLTVTLTTPTNGDHGWADDEGSFWVYNDRWVSMSVDVEKTVVVKNEGMDPGENTFDFLLVFDFSDNDIQFPSLFFTPEGGETAALENEILYSEADEDDGNFYCKLAAAFSMTVQGADTVKGTVTIEGWEKKIGNIGSTELYELGSDTDDWTLEDYKYDLNIGRFDDFVHGVILLKPEFALSRVPQLDAVPPVGEDDDIINDEDGKAFAVRGNNGRWYGFDTAEEAESVEFVNTYTKAPAPAATATPAPTATAKPAQSPKTGDEATPILWILIVIIAVAAVVVLLIVRRKKTK